MSMSDLSEAAERRSIVKKIWMPVSARAGSAHATRKRTIAAEELADPSRVKQGTVSICRRSARERQRVEREDVPS